MLAPRLSNGPQILIVDDARAMAEMLADGLADRGYRTVVTASGEEALARLRDGDLDALVTDLRMPQIDGLALLAEARRVSPDLPVIVMTAYGAIDSAIESMRRGASYYLTKPFKLDELCLFLDRLLDERRVRREASALRAVLGGGVMPVRDLQRRYATWALEQLGGHRTRTAERLGIDLETLAKWLNEADAQGEKE
jgi:two-component system, NtrC family, response regulator HydG